MSYTLQGRAAKAEAFLIFVDEINRFIPQFARNISAVAEQVMRTVVAGRSQHNPVLCSTVQKHC